LGKRLDIELVVPEALEIMVESEGGIDVIVIGSHGMWRQGHPMRLWRT
jgi:hypothetical protein